MVPVLPLGSAEERSGRCLRGHHPAVAGGSVSWHVLYGANEHRCLLCLRQHDERAIWCVIDPANLVDEPGVHLSLVAVPPPARGGVGRITVHVRQHAIGDIDIAVCGPCRRACLEQIRVEEKYRRLGFGRLLLAAALARLPPEHYRWSTTKLEDTIEAKSFWARVDFPGELGKPDYCRDMLVAAGRQVEW